MTAQTLTIGKRRFVVLSERDFLKLQEQAGGPAMKRPRREVNAEFAEDAMRQLRTFRRTRKGADWKDVRATLWAIAMAYAIKLTAKAQRELGALPVKVQKRVARWINLLVDDPHRAPSRQLEGYPDLRRIHASKD